MLLVAAAFPVQATFPGKNGRIAFLLGPDIYTMKPDGSDIRQLTHLTSDTSAFFEAWSPDGKQIVFNEFRPPNFRGELWLMNADGGNQHPLLVAPEFNDLMPSFAPDGNSVVFSRCRTDFEACAPHQIGANGIGLRAINDFDLGIQDFWPQYSADGSLVFTGRSRRGITSALYLQTVLEPGLRRVTPAPLSAQQPDWSPDGRRIAFSSHCCNPQNEEIWVTNAESSELRRLTNNGGDYPTGSHDFQPSWSPEGNSIVFERDAPDFSSSSIFIIGADGGGCRKLVALPHAARPRVPHIMKPHGVQGRMASRHPRQVEAGGALPRWGAMPN
jgi:Tol biopolymer transport system component